MNNKLEISKKTHLKGDDGYKVFSVRVKDSTIAKIDELSAKTNRSRNELINIMLEYSVENCTIKE